MIKRVEYAERWILQFPSNHPPSKSTTDYLTLIKYRANYIVTHYYNILLDTT